MRDSYVLFRDTLHAVSARSALLQRDLRSASDALLHSRARGIEIACTASLSLLVRSRNAMLGVPLARRATAPQRTALDKSLTELRTTLTSCSTEFKALAARDSTGEPRDRARGQAVKNLASIRNFEGAADPFLLSLGIRVRPYGAGANPYAGSSATRN